MRVIFAGHTGINKEAILTNLKQEILHSYYDIPRNHPGEMKIGRTIGIFSPEDEIKSSLNAKTLLPFLESDNEERRRTLWLRGMETVIKKINNEKPDQCLLSLHLTYQRKSRFFSPLAWPGASDLLKGFEPDLIVTLIDDIYEVQKRIDIGSYFRLRELTTWRTVEVLMSDILARDIFSEQTDSPLFPYKHSFVVAAKHSPSMLYNLLFTPDMIKVYACVPISKTRHNAAKRQEIDGVIKELSKHFVVFNPLTIDEKPLENLIIDYSGEIGNVHMQFCDRWPLEESLIPISEGMYPLELDVAEIIEVTQHREGEKNEIQRNIHLRDFRLIDQSDCVVAYRPRYGNTDVSHGMRAETIYAGNIRSIPAPVVFIHDSGMDGELDDPLGPEMSFRASTIDEGVKIILNNIFRKGEEKDGKN